MRQAVHELEATSELNLVQILMSRRHEKDYILRQDPVYLKKHNEVIQQIRQDIYINTELSSERKNEITEIVERYVSSFEQVAAFERLIGLKSNTGLIKKINSQTEKLIYELEKFKAIAENTQRKKNDRLYVSIIIFWFIYILIAIYLSVKIAERFTRSISTLSSRINYFVNSNFTARFTMENSTTIEEVGKLWNNFIKMENEIVEYIELFKEKVYEKTLELSEKNKQISIQNEELAVQKEFSEFKNKDLIDGLRYGWRIQQALLPTSSRLLKQIEKGFVYFSPKDIVSGDIYWTFKSKNKNRNDAIFSVVDCTGHGVPGAFMSILAINAINYAVLNKKAKSPSKILEITNNYVFKTMKYYNSGLGDYQIRDGMDMILCSLDRTKQLLQFSGANRPLFIVRKEENAVSLTLDLGEDEYRKANINGMILFEVLPTKKTVGTQIEKESKLFKNRDLRVEKNDMIYLTSDGYADQFGGPKGKKYMLKRLKNLLTLIYELNELEQKEIIQQSLIDWKGEEDQVDDITIMGVRV
jgi:serine phosphatase RsbU (regulator of sigma subunit)